METDNLSIHETKDDSMDTINNLTKQMTKIDVFSNLKTEDFSNSISGKYDMTRLNRGLVLIFNNKVFSSRLNLNLRKETDKDRDDFKETFQKLGFQAEDIKIFNDFTVKQISDELKKISDKVDHTFYDCLVIAFFTHGYEGRGNWIYGNDGRISLEAVLQLFNEIKCPSLNKKPKMFFIQACQGDRIRPKTEDEELYFTNTSFRFPLPADCLMFYCTVPGFFSWHSTNNGSWFVQSLCSLLSIYGKQRNLTEILTDVTQIIVNKLENDPFKLFFKDNTCMSMPCVQISTLTKSIVFP